MVSSLCADVISRAAPAAGITLPPRLALMTLSMKILVADDDPVSRRILEATLRKWSYEVVSAHDGTEAWRLLQADNSPQLAILDWMMPGLSGVELCRMIRHRNAEPYTYLVLLTSRSNKEDVIEGLDAGADDYLTKPCNQHELEVRLRAGTRILRLQAELMEAREALREQATRDALTGLWNRRSILEILDRELARARREGRPLSLAVSDIDHFKRVNDTYGHLTGDEVLLEVGRRMVASTRSYDSVGRYGGEEFLIVLPGCALENAAVHAERTLTRIGTLPITTPTTEIAVTISVGLTSATLEPGETAQSLIHRADEALYQAKRNGRNRVEVQWPQQATTPSPVPPPQEHAASLPRRRREAAAPLVLQPEEARSCGS
jgi:two-component system, cell cycle response regulator